MGSTGIGYIGRGAMQCESCHLNLAQIKFQDSHWENGATKVVCASCYHGLSLQFIRKDLAVLHQKIEAIERKLGVDEEAATG